VNFTFRRTFIKFQTSLTLSNDFNRHYYEVLYFFFFSLPRCASIILLFFIHVQVQQPKHFLWHFLALCHDLSDNLNSDIVPSHRTLWSEQWHCAHEIECQWWLFRQYSTNTWSYRLKRLPVHLLSLRETNSLHSKVVYSASPLRRKQQVLLLNIWLKLFSVWLIFINFNKSFKISNLWIIMLFNSQPSVTHTP